MTLDYDDLKEATDEQLRRLLEFALDHDPSGPRLRATPPQSRAQIIEQLTWLGVVQGHRRGGWSTGYY